MTRRIEDPQRQEWYEYHGSTAIVRFWKEKDGPGVNRCWLYFDTVEEAMAYFNEVG